MAGATAVFLDALVERVAHAQHKQKNALFFSFPFTAAVFLHWKVVRKNRVDARSGRAQDDVTARRS